ncbi:MAG: hypothetical protein HY074_18550 [Deltaproteobacteria bacterium]|nr:hypothetical protein [Deltaproteobacteria bacterium]
MKVEAFIFTVFLALSAITCMAAPPFSVEEKIPQAIESYYSPRICNVLKAWPPRDVPREEDRAPDLKEVRVLGREGNRVTTAWETRSPVFFVPNTTYELIWTVDASQAQRMVYRFQLKSSNHLKSSDTLIVLEARGDSTLLTTYDYFQLDLGFVGAFATVHKIWKKTFEGYYMGDIALKAQAEHPDWNAKQIRKESEQMLDKFPVEPIQFTSNSALEQTEPVKVTSLH